MNEELQEFIDELRELLDAAIEASVNKGKNTGQPNFKQIYSGEESAYRNIMRFIGLKEELKSLKHTLTYDGTSSDS